MLVIKYCLKFMSRNCRHCTPVGKAAAWFTHISSTSLRVRYTESVCPI
jgi:hypothetical protein